MEIEILPASPFSLRLACFVIMKERADKLLVDRGLAPTLDQARRLIMAGLVFTGEERVEQAGACPWMPERPSP